jgi:hypothetical protein
MMGDFDEDIVALRRLNFSIGGRDWRLKGVVGLL